MLFQAARTFAFCVLDEDGNGLISLAEYQSVVSKKGKTESESNPEFRLIDSNGGEMTDPGEIKEVLRLAGEFQGADNANRPPPNEGYHGNEPYSPPAPEAPPLNGYHENEPYYPQPTPDASPPNGSEK